MEDDAIYGTLAVAADYAAARLAEIHIVTDGETYAVKQCCSDGSASKSICCAG
jgi:hypothetical protein